MKGKLQKRIGKLSSMVIMVGLFKNQKLGRISHSKLENSDNFPERTDRWAVEEYLTCWARLQNQKKGKLRDPELLSAKRKLIIYRTTWQQREKRDVILQEMGFSSYSKYLRSPLWNGIRRRVLSRDNHTCFFCNNRAKKVHHSSYAKRILKGEILRGMVSICYCCHKLLEGIRKKRRYRNLT